MPSIVIRLDPTRLSDPDLDMRYEIPDLLASRSGGLVLDDGYDYEAEPDDGTAALLIFLKTSDTGRALPYVLSLLSNERLHGNHLAEAAVVGVSEADAAAATEYTIVFPSGSEGVLRVKP